MPHGPRAPAQRRGRGPGGCPRHDSAPRRRGASWAGRLPGAPRAVTAAPPSPLATAQRRCCRGPKGRPSHPPLTRPPPARLRWPGSVSHLTHPARRRNATARRLQRLPGETVATRRGPHPGHASWPRLWLAPPLDGHGRQLGPISIHRQDLGPLQAGPGWLPLQSANHIPSWCSHLIFSNFNR